MQVALVDGKLSISVEDLLDSMSSDNKLELIERLSCQDAVIKHVADQIIEGWTVDGHRGAKSVSAHPDPSTALDSAMRRIAIGSSEIAAKEIVALVAEVAILNGNLRDAYNEIENLRSRFKRSYE